MKRKPTRRDLLIIVSRMQGLFGSVCTISSDQNPNRSAQLNVLSVDGLNLAIEALAQDGPVTPSGPWANQGEDERWQAAK